MPDSFINYSEISSLNRLDAEYFHPRFLRFQKKLKGGIYKKLSDLCEFIQSGPAGSTLPASSYIRDGISVLRPSNLNGWSCDNGSDVFVRSEYCEEKGIELYGKRDLLITRVGDLKFGIVEAEGEEKFAISPNVIGVRTKNNLLDPYFLLAFLNTEFGFEQIKRGVKKASLSSVAMSDIATIQIPQISIEKQRGIGKLVRSGLKKIRKSLRLRSNQFLKIRQ